MLRFLTLSLLLCAALPLAACGTATDTPTRGWQVSLRVVDMSTNKLAAYSLEKNGELLYAAGIAAGSVDAARENPTWRDRLTAAEAAPVIDLVESDPDPKAVEPLDGKMTYFINLAPPKGWPHSITTGPTPFAEKLAALLDGIQFSKRQAKFMPPK